MMDGKSGSWALPDHMQNDVSKIYLKALELDGSGYFSLQERLNNLIKKLG